MKYALIGTGKTGQAIQNLIAPQDLVAAFNSRNPISLDVLKQADVGIVFVSGQVFEQISPTLIQSNVPLVIGTTGYAWPDDLDQQLKAAKKCWLLGSNFSTGLNVMHYFAKQLQTSLNKLHKAGMKMGMSESHHIHKVDAPSGTALFLAKSLGFPTQDIAVTREGDIKGIHTVTFDCPHDSISVTHEAHDRIAFAEGVLLACEKIGSLPPGLHYFETLIEDMIRNVVKG